MGAIARRSAGRCAALPSNRCHGRLRRADGRIVDCVLGSIVRSSIVVGAEFTDPEGYARRCAVWQSHVNGSRALCCRLTGRCLRRVSRSRKAACERVGAGAGPAARHTVRRIGAIGRRPSRLVPLLSTFRWWLECGFRRSGRIGDHFRDVFEAHCVRKFTRPSVSLPGILIGVDRGELMDSRLVKGRRKPICYTKPREQLSIAPYIVEPNVAACTVSLFSSVAISGRSTYNET